MKQDVGYRENMLEAGTANTVKDTAIIGLRRD